MEQKTVGLMVGPLDKELGPTMVVSSVAWKVASKDKMMAASLAPPMAARSAAAKAGWMATPKADTTELMTVVSMVAQTAAQTDNLTAGSWDMHLVDLTVGT